ncbi:PREDICTED: serine-rich adhesin for platelets-like, partial [Rhagoletis zephyria]|uniref:serine-rich adhesin for platelets-like n=1 Tax=Rhagoletis zephyria TaxID=28612 RepID=UPI000811209E
MTVSVTQTTQGGSTITSITKPCTASSCYASTRSAAMMALALGHRPRSAATSAAAAATTTTAATTTGNTNNTNNSNNKSINANSNTNSDFSPPPPVGVTNKSPNSVQRNAGNNTDNTRYTTVAAVHMNGGTGVGAGFGSGGSASSSSDNDGFNTSSSSSATALRRFYFKSGRKSKMNSTATTSMTSIPLNAVSTAAAAFHTSISGGLPPTSAAGTAAVPKVVIMGSSSASITDANINTSTDSASTLVTSITHTDTSEACDSLDLGDNSGQSEPLFSSLEEPLLTAIQIDSEHENGTELELTSCNMYNRPDMSVQDSTESQESSLSILTIEPSSTTPLLASHRRQQSNKCGMSAPPAAKLTTSNNAERLPSTAPAPSSGTKHFTFDPPTSPKSARTTEKSRTHFNFKEQQQQPQLPRRGSNWEDQRMHTTNFIEERSPTATRRDNSPSRSKYRAYAAQRHAAAAAAAQAYYEQHHLADDEESLEGTRSKKSRSREASSNTRQRYPPGSNGAATTSPKREQRRSPSSSAPPTMKEAHFFASGVIKTAKQLSPASQQRKYSSSSSSGGSERGRDRTKDSTMFPFDREAIDYDRIQRECFAVDENSSSATTTSDSDDAEPCSVYERKMSVHHISPSKTGEAFQQYKLLAQHEQVQQPLEALVGGPPSRKNSKRIRPSSVIHATIREIQPFVPQTDAFYPQKVKQQSPSEYAAIGVGGSGGGLGSRQHSPKSIGELNKFEEFASKFEQIPPKLQPHAKTTGGSPSGSNNNAALIGSALQAAAVLATNGSGNNNCGMTVGPVAPTTSPTGSLRGMISPPMPNLRVDFFAESQMMHPRKRSSKKKSSTVKAGLTDITHDILDDSQRGAGGGGVSMMLLAGAGGAGGGGGAGPINVTSNPMDVAVCAPPRATIVVQQ